MLKQGDAVNINNLPPGVELTVTAGIVEVVAGGIATVATEQGLMEYPVSWLTKVGETPIDSSTGDQTGPTLKVRHPDDPEDDIPAKRYVAHAPAQFGEDGVVRMGISTVDPSDIKHPSDDEVLLDGDPMLEEKKKLLSHYDKKLTTDPQGEIESLERLAGSVKEESSLAAINARLKSLKSRI